MKKYIRMFNEYKFNDVSPNEIGDLFNRGNNNKNTYHKYNQSINYNKTNHNLFEKKLKDYEIMVNSNSNELINELISEIDSENSDLEYIKDLLTYGHFDIDVIWEMDEDNEWTFLGLATYLNKIDIVNILLENGCNPNITFGSDYLSPLVISITKERYEIFEILLNHPKINPNISDGNEWTPLVYAIEYKNFNLVRDILKHPKTDPNACTYHNYTPLMVAVHIEDKSIIKELLKYPDLDVSIKETYKNQTAWDMASDEIRKEFPNLNPEIRAIRIIQNKKSNDIIDEILDFIEAGNENEDDLENFKRLVKYGNFDINAKLEKYKVYDSYISADYEWTLLNRACCLDRIDMVKILLYDGKADINVKTNVNLKTNYGMTAFLTAVYFSSNDCINEILKHPDVNTNDQTNEGVSALSLLTDIDDVKTFINVMNHPKTDLNIKNIKNETTHLMVAVDSNAYGIIDVLLKDYRVDITLTDKYNQTAWDMASDEIRKRFPQLNPNIQ